MQGLENFSPCYNWPGRLLSALLILNFITTGWSGTISVTNTNNSGAGSFNQAILTANADLGMDTIIFQISGTPPFTISPTATLPAISDSIIIDATTQLGYTGKPLIELNGTSSGNNAGLRFITGFSTLRGMAFEHFPVQTIELDGGTNNIQGNFIGTDTTGALARGSGAGSYGILVKSSGNVIGGTNSNDRNVISGGNDTGIYLLNANNNIIQGNYIGLTAAGTASLSNLNNGIVIYGGTGNLIGGSVPSARNIISGNGASGIYLNGTSAAGNMIQGNYIGTDSSGSNVLGNVAGDGITLLGATKNLICSNLISGNGLAGISVSGIGAISNLMLGNFVGTDVNGKTNLGNHYAGITVWATGGNQIGGTNAGDGNLISGNIQDGITLTSSTSNNLVEGNLIGLSATGSSALHNGQNGISISGGSLNIIGGTASGAGNIISGNSVNGIGILQQTDSGNSVIGNYIGTDITGTKPIANVQTGILIQGCSNTIGVAISGGGNVISGNGQQGIFLVGANGNVTGNIIQGNLIGLDVSGANTLGNGDAGIGISSAANNQIGGTSAGVRNVISANAAEGIFLDGTGTSNNIVQGNYIGTDMTGMIGHGNTFEGITLQNAANTQIGGAATGAGNLISGNNNRGVYLTSASRNIIQGNFIGTKADGSNALGNVFHNIDIDAGSTNNTVGGIAMGAGNRIAFAQSVYCGVRVRTGAFNNLISGNSIFSNGALGIDLSPTDGSTSPGVNPILDCESGAAANAANAGQNFPKLSTIYSGSSTLIRGTMDGKTGKTYALQFFASPISDSSGYGEGQVFLGQTNLTLGSTCSSNFIVYLTVSVPTGWVVTATANDVNNNTSEFSASVPIISIPTLQLTLSNQNQLSISWQNNGGSYNLQQTSSLIPPITWLPVPNIPTLVRSLNSLFVTLSATNSNIFYQLAPQ